jgi:[ribosomal protein S18]-alanine N-acetyltransferase
MIIQSAKPKDIPSILIIEHLSFSHPWTEQHFLYELNQNPFSFVFVALEGNTIIGYIDFWITFETGQINNVAVHPKLRNKGIGRLLIKDALRRMEQGGCERITLEVRVSNIPAIRLYESFGFKILLTKEKYYEDQEDAFFMEKIL